MYIPLSIAGLLVVLNNSLESKYDNSNKANLPEVAGASTQQTDTLSNSFCQCDEHISNISDGDFFKLGNKTYIMLNNKTGYAISKTIEKNLQFNDVSNPSGEYENSLIQKYISTEYSPDSNNSFYLCKSGGVWQISGRSPVQSNAGLLTEAQFNYYSNFGPDGKNTGHKVIGFINQADINETWWLMDPVPGTAESIKSVGSASIENTVYSEVRGVRTTIYLDCNLNAIGGNGTEESPWIIARNEETIEICHLGNPNKSMTVPVSEVSKYTSKGDFIGSCFSNLAYLPNTGSTEGNDSATQVYIALAILLLVVSFLWVPTFTYIYELFRRTIKWMIARTLIKVHSESDQNTLGKVISSYDGEPLSKVLVTVKNERGEIIDHIFTNNEGNFGFKLNPDKEYSFAFQKDDYAFPSAHILHHEYSGQAVTMKEADKLLVPMDEEVIRLSETISLPIFKNLSYILKLIFIAGFIFLLLSLINADNKPQTFVLLGIYGLVMLDQIRQLVTKYND